MRPRYILLVEDDPWVRGACVELLSSLGHTVVAVDDGAVALQEIPRRRPDVILLDLIMPRAELDGIGLLSELAAGLGLGGRDRTMADEAERARQAVRARIRYALDGDLYEAKSNGRNRVVTI